MDVHDDGKLVRKMCNGQNIGPCRAHPTGANCHGLVGTIRAMTWEAGYAGTCSPRSSSGVRQQAC